MTYFAPRVSRNVSALNTEWGTGEELYLRFSVEDTGCGLSEEEMHRLFTRFTQASPKTYVQYGVSFLFTPRKSNHKTDKATGLWPWSFHMQRAHRATRRAYWSLFDPWRRKYLYILHKSQTCHFSRRSRKCEC